MIYANHTKKGTGIEIWGDFEDLANLYNTVSKLLLCDSNESKTRERCRLLSIISSEIRHALCGYREIKNQVDRNKNITTYYGFKVDWITMLYTISTLRYNAALITTDELDQCNLYQLEYWTKSALEAYDSEGARFIKLFINARIDITTEYVYLIHQNILRTYLSQKPSKKRYRNIPDLIISMANGEKLTDFINDMKFYMESEGCLIHDIEIGDDISFEW